MDDFPAKLDQLAIILSPRSCNDSLLLQALTIIHNDVISYSQASKIYVSRGMVPGLVALCRTSSNFLIIILATSLLHYCCATSETVIDQLFQQNGASSLVAMLTARDNSEQGVDLAKQTLILHEQAAKLFVLLTSSSLKYQERLISLDLVKKVVELCSILNKNGAHSNCCAGNDDFSDEARQITKVLEGRKFVGRINPKKSATSKNDPLSILTVQLFDTSTIHKDIDINQQLLIESRLVWPDDLTNKEHAPPKLGIDDDKVWSDIFITKVVDAHCFWAFMDEDVPSTILHLSNLLEDHIYSTDICPATALVCGTRVCFVISKTDSHEWVRGCVLEVYDTANECLVLLVDYGYVVKVDNNQLFPLPDMAQELPYQAHLFVLEGIRAIPKHTQILQYAAELLCNLSQAGHGTRMRVHQSGGTEALLKLCKLPDTRIAKPAVAALANLALNFNIRPQIGFQNGCKIIIELIKKHHDDNEFMELLLSCLLNLSIECYPNRKHIADEQGLLVLIRMYRSNKSTNVIRALVLKAIKNLIGDGWKLLDPLNVPDIRGIIEDSLATVKGCFNLPNLCGDDLIEAVKERRGRRILKDCEVPPDPTYAALSSEELVKKFAGLQSSDPEETSDTDGTRYVRNERIPVKDNNCFLIGHSLNDIKRNDIEKCLCALLNVGKGGQVLIGVDVNGLVIGINSCRKDRDNMRLGIDDVTDMIIPRLTPSSVEVRFVPVKYRSSLGRFEHHEERFIVEINVCENTDVLYQTKSKKLWYKEGTEIVPMTMQLIRLKSIKTQEKRYQAELRS